MNLTDCKTTQDNQVWSFIKAWLTRAIINSFKILLFLKDGIKMFFMDSLPFTVSKNLPEVQRMIGYTELGKIAKLTKG